MKVASQQRPVCCAMVLLRSLSKNGFRMSGKPRPVCGRPDRTITFAHVRRFYGEFVAVHIGHVYIGDQNFNAVIRRELAQSVIATVRRNHLAAEVFKHGRRHIQHHGLVVDYKHNAGHEKCNSQLNTNKRQLARQTLVPAKHFRAAPCSWPRRSLLARPQKVCRHMMGLQRRWRWAAPWNDPQLQNLCRLCTLEEGNRAADSRTFTALYFWSATAAALLIAVTMGFGLATAWNDLGPSNTPQSPSTE